MSVLIYATPVLNLNVQQTTELNVCCRVAIWLYARPNKSNLALFDRSWP